MLDGRFHIDTFGDAARRSDELDRFAVGLTHQATWLAPPDAVPTVVFAAPSAETVRGALARCLAKCNGF